VAFGHTAQLTVALNLIPFSASLGVLPCCYSCFNFCRCVMGAHYCVDSAPAPKREATSWHDPGRSACLGRTSLWPATGDGVSTLRRGIMHPAGSAHVVLAARRPWSTATSRSPDLSPSNTPFDVEIGKQTVCVAPSRTQGIKKYLVFHECLSFRRRSSLGNTSKSWPRGAIRSSTIFRLMLSAYDKIPNSRLQSTSPHRANPIKLFCSFDASAKAVNSRTQGDCVS